MNNNTEEINSGYNNNIPNKPHKVKKIRYVDKINDIIWKFEQYANKIAPTNAEVYTIEFLIMLSQIFKHNFKIKKGGELLFSSRMSSINIQPSRTGKNYGTDIILDISEKIGVIDSTKSTNTTENGIIGQAILDNVNYNASKGLRWDDDPNLRDEGAKQTFRPGLMETNDLIVIEEGKTLFKGGYKDNITRYLQEIMDEKGEIVITTGTGGSFKRKSDCSFIITSVPFENSTMSKIIEDGLFQRCIVTYKEFSEEEIKEFERIKDLKTVINSKDFDEKKEELIENRHLSEKDIENLKLTLKEKEQYIEEITDKIKYKWDNYSKSNEPTTMELTTSSSQLLTKRVSGLIEKYKTSTFGDSVRRVDTFRDSTEMMTLKIASLNAFLNGKNTIDDEDIEVAFRFTEIHFYSITKMLSKIPSNENKINIGLASSVGYEFISKDRVLRKIIAFNRQEEGLCKSILNELICKNYLEIKKDEETGENLYKCKDKIREIGMTDEDYVENKKRGIKEFEKDAKVQLFVRILEKSKNDKKNDNKLMKIFCEIFHPNKSDREPYNLVERYKTFKILADNQNELTLHNTIAKHTKDKEVSESVQKLIEHILNSYYEYFSELQELIKQHKKEINNVEESNKESITQHYNERTSFLHQKYKIKELGELLEVEFNGEDYSHLKSPRILEKF